MKDSVKQDIINLWKAYKNERKTLEYILVCLAEMSNTSFLTVKQVLIEAGELSEENF